MKPALLVIDVQKKFFINESPITIQSLNDAVEMIVPAIALFHEKKLPVVFIQHKDESSGLMPGVEGFDLPDAFDVRPGDIRITKTYGNAFNKTGLTEQLFSIGVDTLILTGYCAEWCVLSTYRGAEDLDLKSIVLLGSLSSGSAENIRFVESLSEVISMGALQALLK